VFEVNVILLRYTVQMQKLLIKYRFQNFPYIVADGKGVLYQLPHAENNYSRAFRKLNPVLNNGVTEGYRINRKFISLHQLRKQAYVSSEVIELDKNDTSFPF
jgi:hypothetical protein